MKFPRVGNVTKKPCKSSLRRRTLAFALGMVACVLLACSNGTGEIQGQIQASTCTSLVDPVAWKKTFGYVGMQAMGEVVEIRLQDAAGRPTWVIGSELDILLIEIFRPSFVKQGDTLPITAFQPSLTAQPPPGTETQPSVRVSLWLGKTCVRNPLPFQITGSLVLPRFGLNEGQEIEGRLTLDLAPVRVGETAQGKLDGSFLLRYHQPADLDKDVFGDSLRP